MRGGIANCPTCGKATSVEGGAEPLFKVLVGLGVVALLAAGLLAWKLAGIMAGVMVLLIGAAILVGVIVAS